MEPGIEATACACELLYVYERRKCDSLTYFLDGKKSVKTTVFIIAFFDEYR